MSYKTLSHEMRDCARQGHTFRRKINSFINEALEKYTTEAVATDIAEAVTEYRQHEEAHYITDITISDDEKLARRKSTNNMCNEVSRICRDRLGWSIVCKSRKNHTYEPVVPTTREAEEEPFLRAEEGPIGTGELTEALRKIDATRDATRVEVAKAYMKEFPIVSMTYLHETLGKEQFGRMAVNILKSIDKQEDS